MRGRNPHACVRTCQHTTMSFRGRGGGRGGGRGRGGRGRGGGRGGRFQHYDYGPPEYVTGKPDTTEVPPYALSCLIFSEVGSFVHPCEEDLVCKGSIEKVPYFNAPIYLENKSQIGKVDEIFGPMNSYVIHFCREKLIPWFLSFLQYFSVKLLPDMKATSFKSEQKVWKLSRGQSTICTVLFFQFFIDPMKLLPLGRFLPRPKSKQIDVWKSCMQCVCFGPAASGKVEKRGGGRGGE